MRRYIVVLPLFVAFISCGGDSTAPASSCTGSVALTIGGNINGTSADNACQGPGGETGQLFTFALPAASNVQFAVSGAFDGDMTLYAGTSEVMRVTGANTFAGRAFLTAGSYTLVLAPKSKSSGAYTINPTSITENANCAAVSYAMKGVSISGSLTGADCNTAVAAERADNFLVRLNTGQSVSVSGSVNRPATFVVLPPNSSVSAVLQAVTAAGGGTVNFTYTATATGYHTIFVSGLPLPTSYSIGIQ